jgi:glycosyltransferase involved in cell wall biosynthesis
MRIVYTVNSISELSGGERVIYEQANYLLRLGFDIEIWSHDTSGIPAFYNEVPIYTLNNENLNEPDVVVICDLSLVKDHVIYRATGQKTFLLVQHDLEWIGQIEHVDTYSSVFVEYESYFKAKSITVLVVSKWLQDIMKEKYKLNAYVIRPGVNKELFRPTSPILNINNKPSILMYYDPQPWKGSAEAILTIKELKVLLPHLEIIMFGKVFPSFNNEEGLLYGLPFDANYFNNPPQEKLSAIYSSADIFLSTSWREGLGLPALEAFACGVPVVTTETGGNQEFAVNNTTAIIIPHNSPLENARTIRRLISNETVLETLKINAHHMVRTYNWKDSIQEFIKLITSPI